MKLRYIFAALVVVPMGMSIGGGPSGDLVASASPGAEQAGQPSEADPALIADACGAGLDAGQRQIVAAASAASARAGVGREGLTVILAAGWVETKLRNLDHGDRDSINWLQQRPSQGWNAGMDADKAADDFFREMQRMYPNWRGMNPGDVAAGVQRPQAQYVPRYPAAVPKAEQIITSCTAPASAPTGASGNVGQLLAWAQTQVGKPYVYGANGPNSWDCSSFSRAAMERGGVTGMPRTAQAQRDWCAAGNCHRIPEGKEQPGDLVFWDSYLGPNKVGHVALVRDPGKRQTVDARGRSQGVINGNYPRAASKSIMEIWRPKALT